MPCDEGERAPSGLKPSRSRNWMPELKRSDQTPLRTSGPKAWAPSAQPNGLGCDLRLHPLLPLASRLEEVPRVGLLELRIAGLGEAQRSPRPLPPLHVGCMRRNHVQVVDMHAKNAKDTADLGQVTADDLFEVGDPPEAPRFHVIFAEQLHTHEDIDRSDDVSLSQDRFNSPNDLRIVFIVPVVFDGDLLHGVTRLTVSAREPCCLRFPSARP